MEWMDEVMVRAALNAQYQEYSRELREVEEAFNALRKSMNEEQQYTLDRYITLIEALEELETSIAYYLGIENADNHA